MDIGAFVTKQSLLFCPHGHGIFKYRQLQKLVPQGGTFSLMSLLLVQLKGNAPQGKRLLIAEPFFKLQLFRVFIHIIVTIISFFCSLKIFRKGPH
jgi:hypothetical protein